MKPALFALACLSLSAAAAEDDVILKALSMETAGPVIHLRGTVEIVTKTTRLQADQADYNKETGVVTAEGHVRVQLLDAASKPKP